MSDTTITTYNVLTNDSTGEFLLSEGNKDVVIHSETDVTTTPNTGITNVCEITPIEAYMSTNLNSKLASYNDVATRILNMLGYPSVGVTELHRDQIFEAISIAVETYTKYCGWSEEVLVFDSRLYKENKGIRLDQLYTIASVEACHDTNSTERAINRGPDQILTDNKDVYVTRVPIPAIDYYLSEKEFEELNANCKDADKELLCHLKDMSRKFPNGIEELSIITGMLYEYLIIRRGYNKD